MKQQNKSIPASLWLSIYAAIFSVVNGSLIINQVESGPVLIVASIPPVILAFLFSSNIYRASLLVFALNLFASRLISPLRPVGLLDWVSYCGLFTLVVITELTGFLSRRQQKLLHDLEKTESELRQQKSFLQLVLNSTPNLISVRDREEKYVLANDAIAKHFDKRADEVVGQHVSKIYRSEEYLRQSLAENEQVYATGQTQYMPDRFMADLQGNPHWYQVTKSPLRNEEGEITHILTVANEITRQKLASEELQNNNQLFRALVQSTQYILDEEFESALHKLLACLGKAVNIDCIFVTENIGSGNTKSFVMCPDRMWLKSAPACNVDISFPLEIPFFPGFARIHGFLSAGQMVRMEELTELEREWLDRVNAKSFLCMPIHVDGEFWGCVGLLNWLDKRDWLEAEINTLALFTSILGTAVARRNDWDELESQEKFTRDVLAALPVDIFVKDLKGEFVMANYVRTKTEDETLEPVIGKTSLELFGNERARKYEQEDKFVIETGQTYLSPIESFMTIEGKEYWRQIKKSPIRDASDKITHVVGIQYDMTEQMAKSEELRKAKEAAEAATRAKSAFLANMSHEIRTPMNAVIGMTSLLTQTALDGEQREYVNTIRTSGETLLGIISKILDFSKIESEQLELEDQPFSLIECLEQTIDLFAHSARNKDLALVLTIKPDVPSHICSDIVRLRQILSNLIDNAIKFTEAGEIVVTVAPSSDAPNTLHFSVSDCGIGMTEEEQQRLFQSFSQVDSSITRRYGGTGLGLAISKRLCEMMNGKMWLESVKDQGSTFHFTTAFRAVADAQPWPKNEWLLKHKRVLLIDEHSRARKELQEMLEQFSATVTVSTPSAFSPQVLDGPPYFLVISKFQTAMAINLRGALEAQKQRTSTETNVLLFSSFGDVHKIKELQAECHCKVVTLPVKPTELRTRISEIVSHCEATPPGRNKLFAIQSNSNNSSVRLLLVEDNAVNRMVALRLLQRLGYQAEVAANGEEAVNLLLRQPFDIVLMDAHMPVMGGLEATQRIRAIIAADRQPYIIGITADALASFREECLAAGMNDYITKPVGIEELTEVLHRATNAIDPKKEKELA